MAETRSAALKAASLRNTTEPKMFQHEPDNVEATVPAKTAAIMAGGGGGSRFALGDIGNIGAKVSSLTLDPSRKPTTGGAVKKEILSQQPLITRQKSLRRAGGVGGVSSSSAVMPPPPAPVPAAATTATTTAAAAVVGARGKLSGVRTSVKASALKTEVYRDLKPSEPAVIVEPVPCAPMEVCEGRSSEAFSCCTVPVEDIDVNDKDNPQFVCEYVNDIYNYMRKMERELCVRPGYLEGRQVTPKMRTILVDWLCQVHHRFHLLQETLYLTVAVLDRFLQQKPVAKDRLQLVGVTSMLLASKYEEMFAPEVADFVYITDNAYTKAEIREMERDILTTLNFSFGRPLCLQFLRRNSKAGHVDAVKHTLAKYLMELTIPEYDMVHLLPSLIAAAALYLSLRLIDNSPWTPTLQFYSTYTEEELLPTVSKLANVILKSETSKQTAIRSKYSSTKFQKISQIPELQSPLIAQLAAENYS